MFWFDFGVDDKNTTTQLELHLNPVFWFGIGWSFPGILPTNTKGKLGQDVSVLYIWQEPLFSLKGRLMPPFWWTKPPFWGKNKFPPNLQKGVPAKFHKMELLPNLTVQKYWTKYRPASVSNLPIPAKLPVDRWWDATLVVTPRSYIEVLLLFSLGDKSSASSDMSRISSASFGILFFYCQKYDIPVPL
jgi:hypothetical protein